MRQMNAQIAAFFAFALFTSMAVVAAPPSVPFDFSRGVIALDARIGAQPVTIMLDTGVYPSVIDINRAETLGLKIDRAAGGEASGVGDAKSAVAFPTTIIGLSIASRNFGPIDAATSNLSVVSQAYGRQLDAILGYSFLKRQMVLIDYRNKTVLLLNRVTEATPTIRSCRRHLNLPFQTLTDDNWPIIPKFRFGTVSGPVTIDTGSNGGIGLFERALALPGLRPSLIEIGEEEHAGFRGTEKSKAYTLNESVGFGPFTLPPGQAVKVGKTSATDQRVANIGNRLFAAMNLKVLLNYPAKQLRFYGNCGD
jgi:Aspartyl protease